MVARREGEGGKLVTASAGASGSAGLWGAGRVGINVAGRLLSAVVLAACRPAERRVVGVEHRLVAVLVSEAPELLLGSQLIACCLMVSQLAHLHSLVRLAGQFQ